MVRKPPTVILVVVTLLSFAATVCIGATDTAGRCIKESDRVRARELGIAPGVLKPGPLNAITDVQGVLVGHTAAGHSLPSRFCVPFEQRVQALLMRARWERAREPLRSVGRAESGPARAAFLHPWAVGPWERSFNPTSAEF